MKKIDNNKFQELIKNSIWTFRTHVDDMDSDMVIISTTINIDNNLDLCDNDPRLYKVIHNLFKNIDITEIIIAEDDIEISLCFLSIYKFKEFIKINYNLNIDFNSSLTYLNDLISTILSIEYNIKDMKNIEK